MFSKHTKKEILVNTQVTTLINAHHTELTSKHTILNSLVNTPYFDPLLVGLSLGSIGQVQQKQHLQAQRRDVRQAGGRHFQI